MKNAYTLIPALLLVTAVGRGDLEWQKETLKEVYRSGDGFYCYAPSLIRAGERDTIFACHNSRPRVIRDNIILLRRDENKGITTKTVLSADNLRTWDSYHLCDPSAVTGSFRYREQTYGCALFYLGNNADACIDNQLGVALSNSWEGPWHRLALPIIPFEIRGGWGAGQPSAVYDKAGRLLLFYTKETPLTDGYVREVNLERAESPRLGVETKLSTGGLLCAEEKSDYWNNFDVAYDARRDRFWAVRELRPYPADQPTEISDSLEVVSIGSDSLLLPNAMWKVEGRLSPAVTGHARNHNACIERTAKGALPDAGRVRILFSTSKSAAECGGDNPLWSYDLWEISATIKDTGE